MLDAVQTGETKRSPEQDRHPGRNAISTGVRVDRGRDALLTDFGRATLDDRYLMPGESYQDLFARVASYYGDDPAHAQRLYDYISRMWVMPATPVLSNGGTQRGLPISCFLNEANDSLDGIVGLWNENVWLASKGGGIGSYWGNLRSIGEKVGQNGKTSGVIPFIRVMDSLTLAISQGSLRRGSAAVYLPISHPEIEEFIELRRPTGGDPNRKALNLHHGVLVPDAFMRAVEADEEWALTSPKDGSVVRKVPARSLWIRMLTARIETGEPYLVFSDHVNRARPEHQKLAGLEVKTSNLCLTGDTRIATDTGLRTLGELFATQEEFSVASDVRTLAGARVAAVRAPNGQMRHSASYGTGVFRSSRVIRTALQAEVWKVTTKSGRVLRGTADHAVMTTRGWVRIGELGRVDRVLVQSGEGTWSTGRALPEVALRVRGPVWAARYANRPLNLPAEWTPELGALLGWLVGDGYVSKERNWPALVFGNREEELIPHFQAILEPWFPGAVKVTRSANCPHLTVRDSRAGEFFAVLGVTTARAHEKRVPAAIWTAPRDAVAGFLKGLFSTDGTVNRTAAGCTVRLGSTSRALLGDVQILLANFGIAGTIYQRRQSGVSVLPSGDRSVGKEYVTKPVWELVIGKENRNRFVAEIGFLNAYKQGNVVEFISRQTARGAYSEAFEDEVVGVGRDGHEDVYDITVEGSHSFVANGIAVHNCSEITLPTGTDQHGQQRTAVCCLSSLNLETWMEWKDQPLFIEDVMRFLDNVLQDFIDRAPEGMERAKYSAMRERSVGLGVMGFHSFLQSQGVPFESVIAKVWNIRMFKHIKAGADAASRMLAEERGACPDAAEYGIPERFSNKTAIAPTASISIITGGTSPGIEPIAANVFLQKTLSGSFTVRNRHLQRLLAEKAMDRDDVWSSITLNKGSVQHLDFLTEQEKAIYRTAFELDQRWVIEHAADRTPYICQSQSVNVFLPANVHKRDLHQIHLLAWKRGVKSLYYCRSLSIQRADAVSEKVVRPTDIAPAAPTPTPAASGEARVNNYEECLACQ